MKILVACEESQIVTKLARAKGHQAWSCDLEPCSGMYPEFHLRRDVLEILHFDWDMVIAFPPCTDLCTSGNRWRREKQLDGREYDSVEFFMEFTRLNHVPKVVIENPIGIMSKRYRKPDQIIQPWMFGHGETKATCLWIKGLPLLKATNIVDGRNNNVQMMGQTKRRAWERSRTYTGIAKAMVTQWM